MKSVYLMLASFPKLSYEEENKTQGGGGLHFPPIFPCDRQLFPMHGLTKHGKAIDFLLPSLLSHEPNAALVWLWSYLVVGEKKTERLK